jgi:hypothetical protein
MKMKKQKFSESITVVLNVSVYSPVSTWTWVITDEEEKIFYKQPSRIQEEGQSSYLIE